MMTKKIFLTLFVFVLSFKLVSAQQYTYTVDLQNITKDRVKVTCTLPHQTAEKIDFIFPNIIPGSYALKEYGRYIDKFKAFDENGNELKIKKADRYNFSILGATKLKKVEYVVNDSWEEKKGDRFIFQPGGTNIDAGKNFVLNNYGFFGYLEGMKNSPFHITILKPAQLKGYSYLNINSSNETTDVIVADNYDKLVDNPIMYCPPQDATFKIGDSEITVCVYAENNKVSALQVADILKPLAVSLQHFFGSLPVDRYLFMFYMADASKIPKRKGKGLGSGFGALEHNHCSFYFMPESSNATYIKQSLSDVCGHEFLHILTPLNVHSKEIDDFNFRTPVMSQHLWMYEGVTEYFSNLSRLQDSLMTMPEFMNEMRSKIIESSKFDIFSMTDMSKNVVTKENQARYLSVYSRGAVLAMMLDILIIDDSHGKNSLRQVMMDLKNKYGPSKPFTDDELIPEITAMTSPIIGEFFKNYIIGTDTPLYQDYFHAIGYSYSPVFVKSIYYFGKFGAYYIEKKNQFLFDDVGDNAFGIENKDVIVSINNSSVTAENVQSVFTNCFFENTTMPNITVVVERDGKQLTLTGAAQDGTRTTGHYITVAPDIDSISTVNFNKFIGNQTNKIDYH